jgi:hypothetical protein
LLLVWFSIFNYHFIASTFVHKYWQFVQYHYPIIVKAHAQTNFKSLSDAISIENFLNFHSGKGPLPLKKSKLSGTERERKVKLSQYICGLSHQNLQQLFVEKGEGTNLGEVDFNIELCCRFLGIFFLFGSCLGYFYKNWAN